MLLWCSIGVGSSSPSSAESSASMVALIATRHELTCENSGCSAMTPSMCLLRSVTLGREAASSAYATS